MVLIGRSSLYSFDFGVAAKTLPASGSVYLNPLGIVNAASYAPVTNSVAPGEFLIAFGTNLATSTLTAQSLPLPKTLGGTSVSINGRPAPIYSISLGQSGQVRELIGERLARKREFPPSTSGR